MMLEMLAAVVVLVLIVVAAFDVFWPFTVALVLVALGAWWREGVTVFWLLWRPEIIGAYVALGFVWVFFKWTRLVERCLRGGDRKPPKWADHSYDFAAYFFYWPIDAAAYLLSDFVQEAWRFLARMVGRSFDRYAEWRFAGRFRQEADASATQAGAVARPGRGSNS